MGVQDDGEADEDSDEEGAEDAKSEDIGSDDKADEEIDDDEDDDEAASRRLTVRTGKRPSASHTSSLPSQASSVHRRIHAMKFSIWQLCKDLILNSEGGQCCTLQGFLMRRQQQLRRSASTQKQRWPILRPT